MNPLNCLVAEVEMKFDFLGCVGCVNFGRLPPNIVAPKKFYGACRSERQPMLCGR